MNQYLLFIPLHMAYEWIPSLQINSRSIQDMYIFGDPLHIPIVIVERVMNAPRRTNSDNSYLRNLGLINSPSSQTGLNLDSANKISASQSSARVLKIVIFVHGFQASLTLMHS